jgi:predicted ATP-grasp superfamily ATP-dependent carboligase
VNSVTERAEIEWRPNRFSDGGRRTHFDSDIPVLVFEGGLTGAGTTRILSESGIKTFAIANDAGIFRYSRFFRAYPNLAGRKLAPSEIVPFLSQLDVPRAVLMPCADDWVKAVADLPEDLRERFPASTPSLTAVEKLVDKWGFAQLLQSLDIPHPETLLLSSIDELAALDKAKVLGRFLKPMASLEFSRRYGVKAVLAADHDEAMRKMSKVQFPIMLQDYIPGPPTNHYFIDGFVDQHGTVCALFARRRLRMHPARVGNSSLMMSIAVEEVAPAAEILKKLLSALRYRGIFSAEFKLDERDGLYKILEINARPWWYIEFAARCGINVCQMAYDDALGRPVRQVSAYEIGRRCVYLSLDFAAFLRQPRRERPSVWKWLTSVWGADEAIFRWSDPGPALAYDFSYLKRRLVGKRSLDGG